MDIVLNRRRNGLLLIVLVSLSLAVAGCGPPAGPERGSVTGKITFDGAPLESGTIELRPAEGVDGVSAGGLILNGQYDIASDKGPFLGKHVVDIRSMRETGKMVPAGGPAGDAMVPETEQFIPAKYNSTTELSIDIQSGENQQDFELTAE